MKITSEVIEIEPTNIIYWADIKTVRLLNDRLILVLSDNNTVELMDLTPLTVDRLFRQYERYLMTQTPTRPLQNKQP